MVCWFNLMEDLLYGFLIGLVVLTFSASFAYIIC
ncbi:hypothetical protein VP496E541_P0108 [Vibrio phage 496E54-1]|nr:hypothetical protein VP495E541_P0109 [Vibrio phage 495E54-1]CAH9013605.1 hypothetical protein VP496E541_P0108 [Vibrio phage 496E54-1]